MEFLYGCRLCTNKIFYVYGPKLISDMLLEAKYIRLNKYLRKGICLMCYKFIYEIYQTRQLYGNRLKISSIYNVNLSEETASCCRTCGKAEPMQDPFTNKSLSIDILQSVFSDIFFFEIQRMFIFCDMCSNLIKILHEFISLCSDLEYMLSVYTIEWIVVLKIHQKWKELLQHSYRLVKTEISRSKMQENSVFITLRDLDEVFDDKSTYSSNSNNIVSVDDDNEDCILLDNQRDNIIDLTLNNIAVRTEQHEDMTLIINDVNDTMDVTEESRDEDTENCINDADVQPPDLKSEAIEIFDELLMTVEEYEKWDNASDISDSPFMGYVDNGNTEIENIDEQDMRLSITREGY
ncbi:uncharacterized protein LOC143199471 [Rhynchophorus ferrugineus]|uniref:uncharacterized protein LOC143199471 n=1 Tax=Rhynchophorus ferrugineus TaxID=354439 RepID=UPI003FCE04C9